MTPPSAAAPGKPGFWSFSTAVYSRPGVKPACLALQEAGLDVNMALWIVWSVVTGRDPGPALGQAMALSAHWRAQAVQPLRDARDALKPAPAYVDPGDAEALRARILAAELEGERLQQRALSRFAAACPPHDRADLAELCAERLQAYAQRAGSGAQTGAFTETVFSALKTV
ncbi:MAG: TIGR02444 family protein [Oceanicaulis sp.]